MSRRVADLRIAIGRDVHELEGRFREAFDLRRQIVRHPLVAAAVVFGGGLVATKIVLMLGKHMQSRAHRIAPERARAI